MMKIYLAGVVTNVLLVLFILWTKRRSREDKSLEFWSLLTVFSWVGTMAILMLIATAALKNNK